MKLLTRIDAYLSLGWRSLVDVGIYRLGLKTGLHPVLRIQPVSVPSGDFFSASFRQDALPASTAVWRDRPWAFGLPCGEPTDDPPDWHSNIKTGARISSPNRRWDKVATFSAEIDDIKTVWEASRFDWLLTFAQDAALGAPGAIEKLNRWLNDWVTRNPAYNGPNWICGQEASIRIAHLVLAAILLDAQNEPSESLEALLLLHLRRVAPTTAYARGQDNNHATSEAMALYVGGLWLLHNSANKSRKDEARRYIEQGRALAEERAGTLIFDDGGFAQYSHVYHRLMLDSLSVMELVRRVFGAPEFSTQFRQQAAKASEWLRFFTQPKNGEVPNMGSNDGAWLLPIGPGDARDFRPSCALASTLFEGRTAFRDTDSAAALLRWLKIEANEPIVAEPASPVRIFADSAIAAISKGKWRIYMRLPGTKFRPHQADALHVDIWYDGRSLLADAGTFTYAGSNWQYFPSTAAHNTVEFDNRNQMPRVSRFLFGHWLKRNSVRIDEDADNPSVQTFYIDSQGARHQRQISCEGDKIEITDTLSGQFNRARIRWRIVSDCADVKLTSHDITYSDESSILSVHYLTSLTVRGKIGILRAPGTYTTSIDVSEEIKHRHGDQPAIAAKTS